MLYYIDTKPIKECSLTYRRLFVIQFEHNQCTFNILCYNIPEAVNGYWNKGYHISQITIQYINTCLHNYKYNPKSMCTISWNVTYEQFLSQKIWFKILNWWRLDCCIPGSHKIDAASMVKKSSEILGNERDHLCSIYSASRKLSLCMWTGKLYNSFNYFMSKLSVLCETPWCTSLSCQTLKRHNAWPDYHISQTKELELLERQIRAMGQIFVLSLCKRARLGTMTKRVDVHVPAMEKFNFFV
jgi:hypothetical protein